MPSSKRESGAKIGTLPAARMRSGGTTAPILTSASAAARERSRPGPGLGHARADDQRLDLGKREHERRKLEAGTEDVADAGRAIDRDAGGLQIADVPIDGPHRDFEMLGELLRGDHAVTAHLLHDLEEAIGPAQGFSLSPQYAACRPTRLPSLSRIWKNAPIPSGRSICGVSSMPPALTTRPTTSASRPSQLR